VTSFDARSSISRRSFLQVVGVGTVGAFAAACDVGGVKDALARTPGGRLTARPSAPTTSVTLGEQPDGSYDTPPLEAHVDWLRALREDLGRVYDRATGAS